MYRCYFDRNKHYVSYVSLMSLMSLNVPLILIVREVIFFYAGKTHNRPFRGVFRGGQDFFDP